jgi:hypothetical protein
MSQGVPYRELVAESSSYNQLQQPKLQAKQEPERECKLSIRNSFRRLICVLQISSPF